MMDHELRLTKTCNLSNDYFLRQATFRWLRPSEIYQILNHHNRFNLTVDPPHKPPSGSLLLFDRKVRRYFRKDGHNWRKKKDGKTVREAHEKLKIGNVEVLHCYYAHGEDNKDFQRRVYWLLEEKLDNIVLVHYRDLSKGTVGNDVCISDHFAGKNMMHDSSHADHMPNDVHLYTDPQSSTESLYQSNILATNRPLEYNNEVSMIQNNTLENEKHPPVHGELSKLDSFGRLTDKEIGIDCVGSLMPSDSYWTDIASEAGDRDVTSLSHHVHFDSMGPSLQGQLFSIQDFSPDGALSGVDTKVLIAGRFLGNWKPADFECACMFGETEVPAELLPTNVIRCQAPIHAPGHVPFYLTRGNRLTCSEVREFESHEDITGESISSAANCKQEDAVNFHLLFAEMVSLGANRKIQACAVENCQKCNLEKYLFPMLCSDTEWDKLEEDIRISKDALLQTLLKGNLFEWLVYKAHEGRGLYVLNKEGLGVIHLAAALGYQGAVKAIVTAGVNPSFRDAKGRTGLHWAAYHGREETVIELIKLGVAPGAVDDPTSKTPEGQTAADLAWINGHKGIAGYLAELDLTSHLSELRRGESTVSGTLSADVAAEDASGTLQRQMTGGLDGDGGGHLALAIHRLLLAVRNSKLAARCVQTALNSESRYKKSSTTSYYEPFEISDEAMLVSSLNNQDPRSIGFNDYLHTVAAAKKQQKPNGYRGNRDFLKVHGRFVKKPHVSEELVSQPYENIDQAVDSLEMAALCWAHSLAPGQQQKATAVMKALEMVKSMALQPDAREQYMRLVTSSHQSQLGTQSTHLAQYQSTVDRLDFGSN